MEDIADRLEAEIRRLRNVCGDSLYLAPRNQLLDAAKAEIEQLRADAAKLLAAMEPAEKKAMWTEQRESWVRGLTTPCEHGVLDFEQCGDCRGA